MPKCSEIAVELRKLADALDDAADVEVIKPNFEFQCFGDGEAFKVAARILPRKLVKQCTGEDEYSSVYLTHDTEALRIRAHSWRQAVCTIVEPAKPPVFRCDPLLSDEDLEEATK